MPIFRIFLFSALQSQRTLYLVESRICRFFLRLAHMFIVLNNICKLPEILFIFSNRLSSSRSVSNSNIHIGAKMESNREHFCAIIFQNFSINSATINGRTPSRSCVFRFNRGCSSHEDECSWDWSEKSVVFRNPLMMWANSYSKIVMGPIVTLGEP